MDEQIIRARASSWPVPARIVCVHVSQPLELSRDGYHDVLRIGLKPSHAGQKFKIWATLAVRARGSSDASRYSSRIVRTMGGNTLHYAQITNRRVSEDGGRDAHTPNYYLVCDAPETIGEVKYALSVLEAPNVGDTNPLLAHAVAERGMTLYVESVDGREFEVLERFVAETLQPPIGEVENLSFSYQSSDSRLHATWTVAEDVDYYMWRHDQGTGTWTDWERVDGNSVNISSPTQGSTYNIEVRGHRSEDDFGPAATEDVDVPPGSRTTSWTTSYLTRYTTTWQEPDRTTCRETWHVTCTDTRPPTTTCWEPWTVTCTDTTPNTITCSDPWTVTCTDTTSETTTCWTTCEQLSTVICTVTSTVTSWQTPAGRDTTRQTSRITEPLPPEPEHETTYDTTYFTALPGGRQTSRTTTWTTCWTTRWESCFTTCMKTTIPTEICRTIQYQTCWATPMPPIQTCWTTRYPTTCRTTPGSATEICWTTRYPTCWTVPGRTRSRQTSRTTERVTSRNTPVT